MYVNDNYGSRWVKNMLNWMRRKTLENYDRLIKDAMLECGLRKQKTIELITEYTEIGIMMYRDRSLFWMDENDVVINTKMIGEEKSKKEFKGRKRLIDRYSDYMMKCAEIGGDPLEFAEWVKTGRPEFPPHYEVIKGNPESLRKERIDEAEEVPNIVLRKEVIENE